MTASSPPDPMSWTVPRNVRNFLRDMAPSTVGARIAELREKLGISQQELADRIGVRSETVSRWERGASSGFYGTEVMARVAVGLEVTPEAIVGPPIESEPGQLDRIEGKIDRISEQIEAAWIRDALPQESTVERAETAASPTTKAPGQQRKRSPKRRRASS